MGGGGGGGGGGWGLGRVVGGGGGGGGGGLRGGGGVHGAIAKGCMLMSIDDVPLFRKGDHGPHAHASISNGHDLVTKSPRVCQDKLVLHPR